MELKLFLAGRVAIQADDLVLADERFPGRQGRLLFAYLVAEQGRPVPRDELAEALWDESPPPKWQKALTVLVSKLRGLLDECGVDGAGALTSAFGCYRLELPEGTWVDVAAAAAAADDAEAGLLAGDPSRAQAAAEEAVALTEQTFVPGGEGEWVERQRRELAAVRARALSSLSEACLRLGDATGAVRWAEHTIAAEPFRESGYRQLMQAQTAAGNRAEALRVYERCRRLLAEELGADPSPETESIYRELLRGTPVRSAVGVVEPAPHEPPKTGGRTRRRLRNRPLLPIAAATALLVPGAVAVAVVGLRSPGGGAHAAAAANSVGVIDPRTSRLVADVAVGSGPTKLAYGSGDLWVIEADDQTVSRVDLATNTIRQTVEVGGGPSALAAGAGAVWVANSLDGTVSRIDMTTNRVVQTIEVGNGPTGIAVGDGSVWVVNRHDATLTKIDSRTGNVLGTLDAGSDPVDVAVGFGAVWVTNGLSDEVAEIDPAANLIVERIPVGRSPLAIAAGAGGVWTANSLDGTVSRIDPAKRAVVRTIPVSDAPTGLGVGSGSIWVSDEQAGSITRIDPASNAPSRPVSVGGRPSGVAASPERLFVAIRPGAAAHRGGTLRVLVTTGAPTDALDPSLASDTIALVVLNLVYDGLTAFRRVGGSDGLQLVPDLAESIPKPTNGGKTFTFTLRPGIRYSNGQLVRPADFRRSLERLFELRGADTYFYSAISGTQHCLQEIRDCDLSRGIVANARTRTVTFRLTRPDPELPYKLAFVSSAAIPRSTPSRPASRRPPPGTGAYLIAEYTPGQHVTLLRSHRFREWSHTARPAGYPDRIVIEFRSFRPAQVRALTKGRIDDLYAESRLLLPAQLRHGDLLHSVSRLGVWYVFLNTRLPPFDDARVRRALSLAVDRRAIVDVVGGRLGAQPACQILPPSFPGYVRNCSGKPDLAEARRLVRASGTAGMRVVVWSVAAAASYMRTIVSALDTLGYRARLHVADFPWNLPAIQAGPWSWFADYPAAGDFAALFSCRSSPDYNPARFCDPRLERKMGRALGLEATDLRAANALWAEVDRTITRQAPYVALLNPKRIDLVSPRVGNYQVNPQWGPLFDQVWVR